MCACGKSSCNSCNPRDWKPAEVASRWQPGDVAMVTALNRRHPYRAFYDSIAKTWRAATGGFCVDEPMTYRPLVVIDPEDREQVERLGELLSYHGDRELFADRMQVALREFANPTPTKPAEPTGTGAVVRDKVGVVWVRMGGHGAVWIAPELSPKHGPTEQQDSYTSIDAVEVLAEGVTL